MRVCLPRPQTQREEWTPEFNLKSGDAHYAGGHAVARFRNS